MFHHSPHSKTTSENLLAPEVNLLLRKINRIRHDWSINYPYFRQQFESLTPKQADILREHLRHNKETILVNKNIKSEEKSSYMQIYGTFLKMLTEIFAKESPKIASVKPCVTEKMFSWDPNNSQYGNYKDQFFFTAQPLEELSQTSQQLNIQQQSIVSPRSFTS